MSDIQKAFYEALTGSTSVMALVSGVFDHVPPKQAMPYIVVGDDTAADWDTDNSTGFEATCTIHVWSEYRGRAEAQSILDEIYSLLHRQPMTMTGYNVIDVQCEYQEVGVDPDGLTRHGVMRFRVIIDKES